MFDRIIAFSLKYRWIILASYALLLVLGTMKVMAMRVDVFPDLNKPTVSLIVEAGGLAPEEVEKLILFPLENVINGASGVSRLSSSTSAGYGIIKAEFDWNTDIYIARQTIMERISQIQSSLPSNTEVIMAPISSIMGEVMLIGLSGDEKISPMELREIAENMLKKRLLAVSGVSNVSVMGGEVKQYHIVLDALQMRLLQISLNDVLEAVENIGFNSTGGFLQKPYQEQLIRIVGRPNSLEDLHKVVVAEGNRHDTPAITLGQIAKIEIAAEANPRGTAGINGKDGVLLSIAKQPNSDTVRLTRVLEQELNAIEKTLPQGVKLEKDIFKQSRFIQNAIDNITESLTEGAVLIALVLFVFLLSLKGVIVVLTVIPCTFLMTALVFGVFNLSINTMTLGGIAMALGSLIDDAIVNVANVYKRLKENRQKLKPETTLHVVFIGCKEVRNSIVFSTMLIFLVFLPLFGLSGIEGKIFTPLALAFILSMMLSMVVAITLTPVLSYYMLPHIKALGRAKDNWVVHKIKQAHAAVLWFFFQNIRKVLVAFVILFIAGIALLSSFGVEFLPPFNEGSFNIAVASAPGTNLTESNRIGKIAEKALLSIPEVEATGRKLGRADLDEHALGININEIEVRLRDNPDRSKEEIVADIREKLTIPGVMINIGQPISHRIDLLISGVQSGIAVKIFGMDAKSLDNVADQVEQIMKKNANLVDVQKDMQIQTPQIEVWFDYDKAVRQGVQLKNAVVNLEAALSGVSVTQMMEKERLYDVVLKFSGKDLQDIEQIKQIPLDTIHDHQVPLGLVAKVSLVKAQNEIIRENASRRRVVAANFIGRDAAGVAQDLQEELNNEIELPSGVFLQIDGQFKTQAEASRNILLLSLLSFGLMFGALYINFKSLNLATQLMISIPLSLVGGVIGIWLTSKVMSVATIIGFVALVGISIRNGILLMEIYLDREQRQGRRLSKKRLLRMTQERLEPVMMTSLTSIIAFLPLIISGNSTGKEILYPLAVVIAFGLLTTTVLNMLITPIIYYHFHPKRKQEEI